MTIIIDKKLTDLLNEGIRLKQGVEKTANGDKVYLYVDSVWSKLPVDLRVYASNGRRFTKDDSLVVWCDNGTYNAAVVSPLDRIDLFETINRSKETQSNDESILRLIQTAQPWLGRVNFSDTSFADLLSHCTFVVVDDESDEQYFATIEKGKLNINKGSGTLGILCASFVLWLKNICLQNKNLYNNILMCCFLENNMRNSKNDKCNYVSKRLLNVNFDNVIDDIYLIVKGYTDSAITISKEALKLLKSNEKRLDQFASELNAKYESTKLIDGFFSIRELAEIYVRDTLTGQNING